MSVQTPRAALIHSVESVPHELRCTIEIGGATHEIFVRTSLPVVLGADIAVALSLIPAMTHGGVLEVEAPVDEGMVRWAPEIQAVLRAFHLSADWTPARPIRHTVELVCPVAPAPTYRTDRGVGTFFSGGLDSFASVLRNPDVSHLIYIAGMDAPVGDAYDAHHERARGAVAEIADRLSMPLITIETNAREMYADLVGPAFGGGILGAAARVVAPEIRRVYAGSSQAYRWLLENSSHPMLDALWARDACELIHEGADLTRTEKLELIADDELVRSKLRVCWAGTGTHYNCCRCEKCLRTMVALEALGILDRFETFPEPLDLDAIAAVRPSVRHEVSYWVEDLELAVSRGASPELIEAIEACVASAEPGGLPTPRRSPLPNPHAGEPRMLFLNPAARAALERSRAVVFLIGAYDGQGGFDELIQLQAAIELLAALGEGVLAMPVIELGELARHRRLDPVQAGALAPGRELLFDARAERAEAAAFELGLIPASLPAGIESAITYLYGGDYFDPVAGERRLSMAEAVAGLVSRAGVRSHRSVTSGLRLDSEWARGGGVRLRTALRGVDRIRVRDPLSERLALHLADRDGHPPSSVSGDDSVAVIVAAAEAASAEAGTAERPTLNLELGWVEDEESLRRLRRFVEGAAEASATAVDVRPVISAPGEDGAAPSIAGLAQALSGLDGVGSVHEPLVLGPARLEDQGPVLRSAELTLARSYHLALTSSIFGVPAVLLQRDRADAQNAEALRREFSLPGELLAPPGADPAEVASRAIALIGPRDARARLQAGLRAAAKRLADRRAAAEEELLTAVGGELATRTEPVPPRGDEDAIDEEYLALLRAHQRAVERLDLATERIRSQDAQLTEIIGSASWRWTTPLRSAGRLLRRRSSSR